jgi:hypothetical protein
MDWEEARSRMLTRWHGIRDAIGTAHPLDLLVEINVVNEFCGKAKEEAGSPWAFCDYCPFYHQFGGCREVSARMGERAAAKDWEALTALVDEFIAHLEALKVPPEYAVPPRPGAEVA